MIGRAITTVGSFSGYEYAENDEKKTYGEKYNLFGETHQEQWDEMRAIATINSSIQRKKYVNAMISFDKSQHPERLTQVQLKEIAERYAKEIGFFNNQWKFAVHTNTDELHIHFFANRIGFDSKNKVKAGNIGKRSGKIADTIAKSYGLKTAKEIGKERRQKALNTLLKIANASRNWNDLKFKMYKKGYHLVLSKNKNGINGARVIPIEQYKPEHLLSEREKVSGKGYKLSQLSRKIKIHDIETILKENHEKTLKNDSEIKINLLKTRNDKLNLFSSKMINSDYKDSEEVISKKRNTKHKM